MIQKYQLKNGLKVLLVESHKSPVVSVQMWVRTGSADEAKKLEGISHFIEHLVFKGTEKFEVGEIAKTVEGAGGELNAYTSFDQTVFYVTISKDFYKVGLDVISEMIGFPKFDPTEIDNEREVVIEEIKRGEDSPQRQAAQALFSTVYKNHPYRVPIIGYDDNIRRVSPKEIKKYFNGRYNPKNMFLLITGDFSSSKIKNDIVDRFQKIPKNKLDVVKRKKETKQTKPRIEVKQGPFKDTILHVAWPIPDLKSKDIPALEVAAMILGQGESSRLTQKLRIQQLVANSVGASTFTPLDPGFFVISASLQKDKINTYMTEMRDVVAEFLSEPPKAEEIAKSVMNLEGDDIFSRETVDGLSRKFGHYEHLFNDYKYQEKFLKQVRAVTPADVLRVSKKYLKPEVMSVVILTEDGVEELKKEASVFQQEFKKVFAKSAPTKKTKNQKPTAKIKWPKTVTEKKIVPQKIELPGGGKIILCPSRELPISFIQSAFLGGLRTERADQGGWTELISRSWTSGSQKFSEEEISKQIESTSGSLSSFGGRNTMGLNLLSLTPHLEKNFEIFEDVLKNPLFPQQPIDREVDVMNHEIKLKSDNPAQVAIQAFSSGIFGGHPYGRDVLGTPESLAKANTEQLKKFWAGNISGNQMTVAMAGHFDVEKWTDRLKKLSASLPKTQSTTQKLTIEPIQKDIETYNFLKKEQSHVVYGFKGIKIDDSRRHTLQVMQSILAGQGGRLFIELRDKQSLAYSVSPLRMDGIEPGYFGVYIGCSPEKAKTAIAGIGIELKKLTDKKVGSEELENAKRYLIGRHHIGLQKISSLASALLFDEIYGIPMENTLNFAELVNSVTSEDIQKLAQDLFNGRKVISVAGSQNPFL